MVQVDDLIEPRLEKSLCPLSRRSLGRIESPSTEPMEEENHAQSRRSICKKSSQSSRRSCKRKYLPSLANADETRVFRIFHGRLIPQASISDSLGIPHLAKW
jgi:hypothetical protein